MTPARVKIKLSEYKNFSLYKKAWLLAPITMWFSYRPLLRFGKNSEMYFELSVTLIYLVVLAVVGLPRIWSAKVSLAKIKSVQLTTAFVILSGVSILWTPSVTKGLLTLGVIGLLYSVFLAALASAKQLKNITGLLTTIFIISAVIMSVLAILQVVAAIWLGQELTLLCSGCTPSQFGFARANVFAIEPQFFGNLLLTPLLITAQLFIKKPNRLLGSCLLVMLMALFLTLSRGAVFGFIIGAIILFALEIRRLNRTAQLSGIIITSFVAALLIQGAVASINPKIETSFMDAMKASISQLSLGVVDDAHNEPPSSEKNTTGQQQQRSKNIDDTVDESIPNFDGYVEESTGVRLRLSNLALQAWARSPERAIFGVGVGGSGNVLRKEFPEQVNNREIVQNEYAELLLENGLVGLGLFLVIISLLLFSLRNSGWTWAIVAAFLVQWNFFSGYPNALHIYLIFTLLAIINTSTGNKAKTQLLSAD